MMSSQNKIRKKLKSLIPTQREVSVEIGIHHVNLSKFINGKDFSENGTSIQKINKWIIKKEEGIILSTEK